MLECRYGDVPTELPLAEVGNTAATVAATAALDAAPAFGAFAAGTDMCKRAIGSAVARPFGKEEAGCLLLLLSVDPLDYHSAMPLAVVDSGYLWCLYHL